MATIASREDLERELIARAFPLFAHVIRGKDFLTPFHLSYYKVLNEFAQGRIKRLIITVPPQHGKSEGSTRLLPAYMLGLNPDLKIAIASYADTLAKSFNRSVQRTITENNYSLVFPETKLSEGDDKYAKNSKVFEVVGHKGELRSTGRGGPLTGNAVDIMIMDDLYKDAKEANSPVIREATWEWYTSTAKTRLHNDSQELIVFTRWHEDDLIGCIEAKETVIELKALSDIIENDNRTDVWYKLNFEAIKESESTELDPRQYGEPLWGERHSLSMLNAKRNLDKLKFDCMYQGSPMSKEGLLYGDGFSTYYTLPTDTIKKGNYTDTADMGDDYLCSICYEVGRDKNIYINDVYYTQEPMEVTEGGVADMLILNHTRTAYVESNNGGRGFARAVVKLVTKVTKLTTVKWFHQSTNKESRILTNASTVKNCIIMPEDWKKKWPQFYLHIVGYKRKYSANKFHDASDVLTGIIEKEIAVVKKGGFQREN